MESSVSNKMLSVPLLLYATSIVLIGILWKYMSV